MASDLPKEFDVIVLGTGMPESIVAAAFSRIGQSVLHLDRNEFYSGDWASFSLKAIENWVKENQPDYNGSLENKIKRPELDELALLEEGETLVQLPLYNSSFSNVKAEYFAREDDEDIIDKVDGLSVSNDKPDPVSLELINQQKQENENDDTVDTDKETIHKTDTHPTDIQGAAKATSESSKQTGAKCEIPDDKKETKGESVETQDGLESAAEEKTEKLDEKEVIAKEDYQQQESNVLNKDNAQSEKAKEEILWTVKRLKAEWRKFNIDISPKLLFSSGDMVELLISSDIAKYCEFKTVTRVLTVLNGQLEVVPCSRAGVFSSKTLSMLEKRMLMKFLQFCAEYENKQEEFAEFLDRPFVDFLASKKLSSNVKHYIQHSIAMATESTTTQQGLSQMRKFLRSLGRYGNTAFLWSLYGSGELPQSFCRMCAVFGGLYCLRMSASSLIVDSENQCTGIVTTEGQRIKCKYLIMENSYAPKEYLSERACKQMSRAVIMTDSPLLPSGQHELSQMCLPCPDDGDRPVFVIELPPSSLSTASGVYLFHLTRLGKEGISAEEDLAYVVNLLFKHNSESEEAKPCVLWSLYFCQQDTSLVQPSQALPANVVLMSGPGMEIDIDRTVQEAKEVFLHILPEEEFLPKAPNPEDIVYVDDAEMKVADDNTPSDFTDSDKQGDDDQSGSKDETTVDQSEARTDEGFKNQSESGTEENHEELSKTEQSETSTCSENVEEAQSE